MTIRGQAGSARDWRNALTLLAMTVAVMSCRPERAHEAFPREGHGAPAADGHEPAAPGEHGGAAAGHVDDFAVDAVLRSIPAGEVVGFVGPDGEPFQVALRTSQVGHYPCSSCHIRPIGSKTVTLGQMHSPRAEHAGAARVDCVGCHDPTRPGGLVIDCAECHEREGQLDLMPSRSAHLTVELSHPSGRERNCLTCHAPQNPGLLTLRDGQTATLDQAYQLCSGCHFMQAEDWAGGAHGKRLAGWSGQRTILSCTGCHDPHDPTFPVRRPVTFPKIARPGSDR